MPDFSPPPFESPHGSVLDVFTSPVPRGAAADGYGILGHLA